jgi:hypothetical protein
MAAKKQKVQIGQINRDQAAEKPGLKLTYCAPTSPRALLSLVDSEHLSVGEGVSR